MIRVLMKPEPDAFDKKVRKPGNLYLKFKPKPTSKEWKKDGKEYWQKMLPTARKLYNQCCAYCATWIPHSTGTHSMDHFLPKGNYPELAYEWSNYRYASPRFNSRKRTETIADPFCIGIDDFNMDLGSLMIKPSNDLLPGAQKLVHDTIETLKLNHDPALVEERWKYFSLYKDGDCSLDFLKRDAPFIAKEIIRQGFKRD